MSEQYNYCIYTKNSKEGKKPYIYDYDRITGIKLSVNKSGFHLNYYRSTKKTSDEVLNERFFRDAIKKVCFLQIVRYGQCCTIKELTISINGESKTLLFDNETKLLYPLCGNKLIEPLGESWNRKHIYDAIINTTKSKYDRRFAATFAFLTSRSKAYETERFMYLWMAINALYGYVSDLAKENLPESGKEWIKKEYAQIRFLSLIMGFPYEPINKSSTNEEKKENNIVRYSLEKICAAIPFNSIVPFVEACRNDDRSNQWIAEIHTLLENHNADGKIHPFMLMLLWFPYQLRCKYFHGETPIPFLCFKDEHPLPSLRVVNHILDSYLDDNLPHWFIDDGQSETIGTVAGSCSFGGRKGSYYLSSCSKFQISRIDII